MASPRTFAKPPSKHQLHPMPPQLERVGPSSERQIQTALQALKRDAKLPLRSAAAFYNVAEATLRDRRAGRPSQADRWPKSRNLTKTEEDVVVKHILELVTRGFPPWLADVANMANSLRAERNLGVRYNEVLMDDLRY